MTIKNDAKFNFSQHFAAGKRWKSNSFLIVYAVVSNLNITSANAQSQWAVVASKKAVSKRAHDRNRAKRRLRALMKHFLRQSPEADGEGVPHNLHLCLLANTRILQTPWEDLCTEMKRFLIWQRTPAKLTTTQP